MLSCPKQTRLTKGRAKSETVDRLRTWLWELVRGDDRACVPLRYPLARSRCPDVPKITTHILQSREASTPRFERRKAERETDIRHVSVAPLGAKSCPTTDGLEMRQVLPLLHSLLKLFHVLFQVVSGLCVRVADVLQGGRCLGDGYIKYIRRAILYARS